MIERNADLRAFQERIRQGCGKDFVTVMDVVRIVGIGKDTLYPLLRDLPRVGGKLFVDDAAERIYERVRPRAKRCG